MISRPKTVVAFVAALGLAGAPAAAQAPDVVWETTHSLSIDSGWVTPPSEFGWTPQMLFSEVVSIPGAGYLRLQVESAAFSGDPAANGAFLRLESLEDGDEQTLNAQALAEWGYQSASLRGDAVRVELWAYPATGLCRVVIGSAIAGLPPIGGADDLCGVDNRTLSNDPRVCRLTVGCTGWLAPDTNNQVFSAGHCPAATAQLWFNQPLSTPGGFLVAPPIADQYALDATSIQATDAGPGSDYLYVGAFPNSQTGLMPAQKQGSWFEIANATSSLVGQTARVTGHGSVSAPVSPTWQSVQKSGTGPVLNVTSSSMFYAVDTTGGDSGAPVTIESTGAVVAFHTHAGCIAGGNQGTSMQQFAVQAALASPLGMCRTGKGVIVYPLLAIGDRANNFGTLNLSTGNFAKVSRHPNGRFWQGLAYAADIELCYAINTPRELWTINPISGEHQLLGVVLGFAGVINGLAYDAASGVLYGIAQANGQLLRIDPATLVATAIGAPSGGTVGALEFDPTAGVLYGLDDGSPPTKLVRFDTQTGVKTQVGSLGAAFADCNGLGYVAETDALYTINAQNEALVQINKLNGVATTIGSTGGVFGSEYGLTAILPPPPRPCIGDLSGDGAVADEDLGLLLDAYGNGSAGDIDGDGDTDDSDLGLLLDAFAKPCP